MKIKLMFIALIICLFSKVANCQNLEIVGEAKIQQMTLDNAANDLVIRQNDGTLGVRNASSLMAASTGIDTSRNLASDLALARHICECGTNFPPFLVKSLLQNGYTERDLLDAGVPFNNIHVAKPILDGDGNEYTSVVIGNQTWLRENLRTTSYNDGTPIPNGVVSTNWVSASTNTTPAFCWPNGSSVEITGFGALYNWYSLSPSNNSNKNVCPLGWHVPSLTEATTLANSLGGGTVAGGKLKQQGNLFWDAPNVAASNSSGFGAVGDGRRSNTGSFSRYQRTQYFWYENESPSFATNARRGYIQYTGGNFFFNDGSSFNKGYGLSVRCIKD